MVSTIDTYWMHRALALSQQGMGWVNPNPMVGAIVVDGLGNKIASGYHQRYGGDHAEKIALDVAGSKAKGATLYVTLEPCSHHGNTPPCHQAVLSAGIKKVVIGSLDPSLQVSSVELMRAQGVEVVTGVLSAHVQKLNRMFFAKIRGQSYVMAKFAVSRDGYIGHKDRRVIISGAQTISHTMKLRAMVDGILVGSHTWQTDNPKLNVRGKYSDRMPTRIFLDTRLQMPSTAAVFGETGGPVVLVYDPAQAKPASWMSAQEVRCLPLNQKHGQFEPAELLQALATQGIQSILVEGGAHTIADFATAGCIDDVVIYHSPSKLSADGTSQNLVKAPKLPFSLDLQSAIRCGRDWVWTTL